MEAGWSESGRNLIEDARLWLWGTVPPVEFVILVDHTESKVLCDVRPESEKKSRKSTGKEMEENVSNGKPIELMDSQPPVRPPTNYPPPRAQATYLGHTFYGARKL